MITQRSVLQLSLTWRSRNLFTSGGELSRWKGGFYIEVFILDEKRRVLPIGESKEDFENKEPVQSLKGRCQPAQEESKRCPSRFLCLCRTFCCWCAAFKESLSPPTAADVAVPQNPSSIDRWDNINLRRIRLLALAQPWLPLPDSTHFSILELPLQWASREREVSLVDPGFFRRSHLCPTRREGSWLAYRHLMNSTTGFQAVKKPLAPIGLRLTNILRWDIGLPGKSQ